MSTSGAAETVQIEQRFEHHILATQFTRPHIPEFEIATDDAYPLRDVRIHQLVKRAYFARSESPVMRGQHPLQRVLRVKKVLVPYAAAAALDGRRDYVRLGLPARIVRGIFRDHDRRKDQLDDPLYDADAAAAADIWWVRAWPSDALATAVAADADGTVHRHDAAALLRHTGHGFAATVDLAFDFFFTTERPDDQGPLQPAHVRRANRRLLPLRIHPPRPRAQGPVVTVVRSVLADKHIGRPEPVCRPGVDEEAEFGCHLPTYWDVLPASVLAALGLLAATTAEEEEEAGRGPLQLPPIVATSPLLLPMEVAYGSLLLQDAHAAAAAAGRAEDGLRPDAARPVDARPVAVQEGGYVAVGDHVWLDKAGTGV